MKHSVLFFPWISFHILHGQWRQVTIRQSAPSFQLRTKVTTNLSLDRSHDLRQWTLLSSIFGQSSRNKYALLLEKFWLFHSYLIERAIESLHCIKIFFYPDSSWNNYLKTFELLEYQTHKILCTRKHNLFELFFEDLFTLLHKERLWGIYFKWFKTYF